MRIAFAGIAAVGLLLALPAEAKTIVVHIKNAGAGGAMVFEPSLIKADVGDIVRFVPADPGHNAQTIDGMVPAGVPASGGKINQPFDLKIAKPRFYGIKCVPHFSMGMVALIKAGNGHAPNAAAARAAKLPPLAARRMMPMLNAAK